MPKTPCFSQSHIRPIPGLFPRPALLSPVHAGPCPGGKDVSSEPGEHVSVCLPQQTSLNLNLNRFLFLIKEKVVRHQVFKMQCNQLGSRLYDREKTPNQCAFHVGMVAELSPDWS